jgi:hypothetical protein
MVEAVGIMPMGKAVADTSNVVEDVFRLWAIETYGVANVDLGSQSPDAASSFSKESVVIFFGEPDKTVADGVAQDILEQGDHAYRARAVAGCVRV